MREFDSKGLKLAKGQAYLFENSIKRYKGSSAIFIRSFMYSKEAQKIDRTLELDSASIIYSNNSDYLSKGTEKYEPDIIYWIGYIYRYWAYTFEMSSKQIYKIANAETMRSLYFAYHTMDPKFAIERILEEKEINIDKSFEYQCQLYKKIIMQKDIRQKYRKSVLKANKEDRKKMKKYNPKEKF